MEKRRSTKNRKQAKPPIAKEKSASARNSAAGSFLSSSPLKSKYQRLKDILIRPVPDNTLSPIVNRATEVIGDRDDAMRWLGTPVRGLDYATPISLLGTEEGAIRVNDILGQMEHGIW